MKKALPSPQVEKARAAALIAAAVFLVLTGPASYSGMPAWKTYEGAWFEISYPGNFIVTPSLRSPTKAEGFDSVFFGSTDSKVKFYVFSPQWKGDPSDIGLNAAKETVTAKERVSNRDRTVTRWTCSAKDGSYYRSVEETEIRDLNVSYAFGIIYQDRRSYLKYKPDYLRFKRSIKRSAD